KKELQIFSVKEEMKSCQTSTCSRMRPSRVAFLRTIEVQRLARPLQNLK
uniref:Uncharacterized protein n=1 Tax=Oryzias latipes TaxID=8090 RepID=A0A3P9IWI3_ORYLA